MEERSLVPSMSNSTPFTKSQVHRMNSSAGIIENGIIEESETEVATDANDTICSSLALWEDANTTAGKQIIKFLGLSIYRKEST